MSTFSRRLKMRRNEQLLTQLDIADALEVHPITLSHWEHSRRIPSGIQIIELCKLLECSSDWLFGLEADLDEDKHRAESVPDPIERSPWEVDII